MLKSGVFKQDEGEYLYIYQNNGQLKKQTGIVGCASVDDYMNDIIKKHELTRPTKKKTEKTMFVLEHECSACVFFAYPAVKEIDAIVK